MYARVPTSGDIDQDELLAVTGAVGKVGMSKAVQNKWLTVSKGEGKSKLVARAVESIVDLVQMQLKELEETGIAPEGEAFKELKKRKLLESKQQSRSRKSETLLTKTMKLRCRVGQPTGAAGAQLLFEHE